MVIELRGLKKDTTRAIWGLHHAAIPDNYRAYVRPKQCTYRLTEYVSIFARVTRVCAISWY